MEKTRRLKTFSIVALIVAVLGLTIAFAALSKTLTINGTGTVDAANWDIHFKNISEASLTGKGATTGTPTLADNGATINDMKVSLKEPGDKVVYTVDIENSGDINAEIDSITLPTFTTAQSNILDFKAVYTSNNKEIATGDILESKEVKNVTITIMYKDITDESLLPKEGISINLNYELHFVQTDKASGSSSQGGNNPTSSYGVAIASKQLSDTITATYYGGEEQEDGTYQGGTLVISGTGEVPDCEEYINYDLLMFLTTTSTQDELIEKYDGEKFNFVYNPISLVIEEGIIRIGNYSFSRIHTIKNVSFPSSLLSIGYIAFEGTSITSVNIPSSVKKYENLGVNLMNITLNEGLEMIGDDAFASYTGTSIRIPSTVRSLGTYIFEDSESIKEVYIGSEDLEIDSKSFDRIYTTDGVTVYCKNQTVANKIHADNVIVIVDPSKFE